MFIGRTLWWLLTLPFRLARPGSEGFRKGRPFPVRVVSVQDGDSFQAVPVNRADRRIRVRLYGIDAPEHDQDFGRQATARLSSLVRGKNDLTLEYKDTDRYGRLIGVLYFRSSGPQRSVNRVMVEEGLARWFSRYGGQELGLDEAEQNARRAKRGIWASSRQVAPWDHRREQRRQASARRGLFRTLLLATVISVAVVVAFYFLRQAI